MGHFVLRAPDIMYHSQLHRGIHQHHRDYFFVGGHAHLRVLHTAGRHSDLPRGGKQNIANCAERFGLARASVDLSSDQAVDLADLPIALLSVHRPSSTQVIAAESCSEDAAASRTTSTCASAS